MSTVNAPNQASGWAKLPLIGSTALLLAFAISSVINKWIADPSAGWSDPDSMMRLVEVRDFLSGQSWFDYTQHRLNPPIGVTMHWSRLVDAGMAGFWSLMKLFVGPEIAERLLVNLWAPLLLLPLGIALAAAAYPLAGSSGAVLTILVLVCSPVVTSNFKPGALDHHNLQLVLLGGILVGLSRLDRACGAIAVGSAGALSLAVGMEQLAIIAAVCILITFRWVWIGMAARISTAAFALTFCAAVVALFLAQVRPDRWSYAACDALSISYVVPATIGAIGLAGLAAHLKFWTDDWRGRFERALGVLFLVTVILAVAGVWFPACLAGPYAQVDPALYPIWLDHVEEAQSLGSLFTNKPVDIVVFLVPPVLSLIACVAFMCVSASDRFGLVCFAFPLAAALVTSMFQIRGAAAAQCIAAPLSGVLIIKLRSFIAPSYLSPFWLVPRLGGALLVPLMWVLLAVGLTSRGEEKATKAASMVACQTALLKGLGSLPPGTIAASVNLGSFLLATTAHSVLAAPYHRNAAGILAVTDLWTGNSEAALMLVAEKKISYIAICDGEPAQELFLTLRPHGFLSSLRSDPPGWLLDIWNDGVVQIFKVNYPPVGSDPPPWGRPGGMLME